MKHRIEFKLIKPMQGLSLIELMVALAVSAILLLGVATVYTASKRSYKVNTGIAVIQENARFAMHTLAKEIRQAGYTGCQNVDSVDINVASNIVPAGFYPPGGPPDSPAPFQALFNENTVVMGHVIDGAGNATPPFHPGLAPAGIQPAPNTHAITILKASACSADVTNINPANMLVTGNCNFRENEILLITNCQNSHMFMNTAIDQFNRVTTLTFPPGQNQRDGDRLDDIYGQGSRVHKVEAMVFYIGADPNDPNNNPHLYENRLTLNAGAYLPVSRLLIPNVQNMVIRYGLDTTADLPVEGPQSRSVDNAPLSLATEVNGLNVDDELMDDLTDAPWSRVTRVDIRLLVASDDNAASTPQAYSFDGNLFDGNANPLPNDFRYRREFVTAINLRNRTP